MARIATAVAALERGPWMQTASGHVVSLLSPAPAAISVRDIACHLAKIGRFAGATSEFYSVAQHSVLVSVMMADHGPKGRMYGLLHDAHEAYLGDIPTPVKQALGSFKPPIADALRELQQVMDVVIHVAVGLSWPPPPDIIAAIKHADARALATERRDLMADGPDWGPMPQPWRARLRPHPWPKAEEKFIAEFDELAVMLGMACAR